MRLWLPELDLGAVRIDDPREPAGWVLVIAFKNIHALRSKPSYERVHIIHCEIQHEVFGRGREIVALRGESVPDRMRRVVGRVVAQECATPRFKLDSENVLIPGGKRFRVVTLYEDTAKACAPTNVLDIIMAEHNSALATRVRPLMLSIPSAVSTAQGACSGL